MLTVHDRKMKYLILELWLNEPGELGKKNASSTLLCWDNQNDEIWVLYHLELSF